MTWWRSSDAREQAEREQALAALRRELGLDVTREQLIAELFGELVAGCARRGAGRARETVSTTETAPQRRRHLGQARPSGGKGWRWVGADYGALLAVLAADDGVRAGARQAHVGWSHTLRRTLDRHGQPRVGWLQLFRTSDMASVFSIHFWDLVWAADARLPRFIYHEDLPEYAMMILIIGLIIAAVALTRRIRRSTQTDIRVTAYITEDDLKPHDSTTRPIVFEIPLLVHVAMVVSFLAALAVEVEPGSLLLLSIGPCVATLLVGVNRLAECHTGLARKNGYNWFVSATVMLCCIVIIVQQPLITSQPTPQSLGLGLMSSLLVHIIIQVLSARVRVWKDRDLRDAYRVTHFLSVLCVLAAPFYLPMPLLLGAIILRYRVIEAMLARPYVYLYSFGHPDLMLVTERVVGPGISRHGIAVGFTKPGLQHLSKHRGNFWSLNIRPRFHLALQSEWQGIVTRRLSVCRGAVVDITGCTGSVIWELEQCLARVKSDGILVICKQGECAEGVRASIPHDVQYHEYTIEDHRLNHAKDVVDNWARLHLEYEIPVPPPPSRIASLAADLIILGVPLVLLLLIILMFAM